MFYMGLCLFFGPHGLMLIQPCPAAHPDLYTDSALSGVVQFDEPIRTWLDQCGLRSEICNRGAGFALGGHTESLAHVCGLFLFNCSKCPRMDAVSRSTSDDPWDQSLGADAFGG